MLSQGGQGKFRYENVNVVFMYVYLSNHIIYLFQ